MKEFTCESCNETFEEGWSDEEAMDEAASLFGEGVRDSKDNATVCDDCFQKIVTHFREVKL